MANNYSNELAVLAQEARDMVFEVAEESSEAVRKLFVDVVEFSPSPEMGSRYSTGRFIANWMIGAVPVNRTINSTSTLSNKIQMVRAEVTDSHFLQYDTIYLLNSLDYAHNVEFDGWNRTGAYAPVAQAVVKNMI